MTRTDGSVVVRQDSGTRHMNGLMRPEHHNGCCANRPSDWQIKSWNLLVPITAKPGYFMATRPQLLQTMACRASSVATRPPQRPHRPLASLRVPWATMGVPGRRRVSRVRLLSDKGAHRATEGCQ